MIAEGKGIIAPARCKIAFNDHERRVLFQCALHLNRYKSDGGWAGGFVGSIEVPNLGTLPPTAAPIYVGKLGEWAVTELARRRFGALVPPVDMTRKPLGDGGEDLIILRLGMQLKTRRRKDAVSLVRVTDDRKRPIGLKGDVHVFCEWLGSGDMIVGVLGWKWTRDLAKYPHVPARRGDHLNIEIPDTHLQPMTRLWAEIESRRVA